MEIPANLVGSTVEVYHYPDSVLPNIDQSSEQDEGLPQWQISASEIFVQGCSAGFLTTRWITPESFHKAYPDGILSALEDRLGKPLENPAATLERYRKDIDPDGELKDHELIQELESRDVLFNINKNVFLNKPTPMFTQIYSELDKQKRVFPSLNCWQDRNEQQNYRGLGLASLLYQTHAQWLAQTWGLLLHSSLSQTNSAQNNWLRINNRFPDCIDYSNYNRIKRVVLNGSKINLQVPNWIGSLLVVEKNLSIIGKNYPPAEDILIPCDPIYNESQEEVPGLKI